MKNVITACIVGFVLVHPALSYASSRCALPSKYVRQIDALTWEVAPTNYSAANPLYGQCDGDNIQYAIDQAAIGATVRLLRGTFVLSKIADPSDEFEVNTARGSFRYLSQRKQQFLYGGLPAVLMQSINLHKAGLTLAGETVPGTDPKDRLPDGTLASRPLTTILYPYFKYASASEGLAGSTASFVINAPRVTVTGLRLDGFDTPIDAYHPGFDIRSNWMVNVGSSDLLSPDVELTYPRWPDTGDPVVSFYRNNHLINVLQPPHVVGSEVVVRNNHIVYIPCSLGHDEWGCFRGGIAVLNWSFGNDVGTSPFNHQINWDHVFNVRVEGNYVDCQGAWPALFVNNPDWGQTGVIRDVQVLNNVVENCDYGMFVVDYRTTRGDDILGARITGNTFRNIWGTSFDPFSYYDPSGIRGLLFRDNRFERVGWGLEWPGGVWLEVGVRDAIIEGNDYAASGCPSWSSGIGCVLLGVGSAGNQINETRFPPGQTMCDAVLDVGSNAVPGYGVCFRNPEQAVHLGNVLEKAKEGLDIPPH